MTNDNRSNPLRTAVAIFLGTRPLRTLLFESPCITIGSSRHAALILRYPGINPIHCRLVRVGRKLAFEDGHPQICDGSPPSDSAPLEAERSVSHRIGPISITAMLDEIGSPAPDLPATVVESFRRLISSQRIDSASVGQQEVRLPDRRAETLRALRELLATPELPEFPTGLSVEQLLLAVDAELFGLGPLDALLADPCISEIMVNGPEQTFVEVDGRLQPSPVTISTSNAIMAIIERIVSPLGRRIDRASPMVDARLSDGSRVHAVIPPIALNGPILTIRKFNQRLHSIDDLIQRNALSADAADYLQHAVSGRKNIVIFGGASSGKTTLLNLLSRFILDDERLITIEDSAELELHHQHVIRLEARPPNIEGAGEITIRDLLKTALRMRPDRIIVGECRGPEAVDMLQALNTGHAGSLTTLHANSPRDALTRLETMVLMAGVGLSSLAIRQQLASAIQLLVQTERCKGGHRRVRSVVELAGIDESVILLHEVYHIGDRQAGLSETKPGAFAPATTMSSFPSGPPVLLRRG